VWNIIHSCKFFCNCHPCFYLSFIWKIPLFWFFILSFYFITAYLFKLIPLLYFFFLLLSLSFSFSLFQFNQESTFALIFLTLFLKFFLSFSCFILICSTQFLSLSSTHTQLSILLFSFFLSFFHSFLPNLSSSTSPWFKFTNVLCAALHQ
jgi:hypothetical protein